jgi:16S rRNA (cytosine967-C5)-methyltransferase
VTAAPRRAGRHPASDPARQAAYDAVLAVAQADAYANLLLPALLRERGLSGRDAALATELTYGSLRWQGSLDAVLARGSSRPLAGLDPAVLALLRLGAYQLLHLRVPPHAAVSATVELVPDRARGFVNAVLRRVSERSWPQWLALLAPPDEVDRLALMHAHPRWVVRAFADALGSLAAAEVALAADNERPVVHLVARPGRISRTELLAAAGVEARPGPWSPYAVRLAGGNPAELAAVRDGRAAVQDEGSQLVALAAAAATPAEAGPRRAWLDVAAGPGGKAALLAGLAAERRSRLLANDLAPHRARLVAQALRGTGALTVCADGRVPAWPDGCFDLVLLDAPCTGLGALRRRPEARWRRQPADVARLAALQHGLLQRAMDAARVGGAVLYAACSPHLAETTGVVIDLLHQRRDVSQEDARPLFAGLPQLGDGPHVQLWPHLHGTDAMFAALLRRVA